MERYVFGVDVGGTTVKIGLFDAAGEILQKWEILTRTENHGKEILPDVAKAILGKMEEKKLSGEDVIGIGLGVPGPVDGTGTVQAAVNLGWGVTEAEMEMEKLTGLSTRVGNDANVAALGEMWKGGGRGYRSLVAVTLGTGIGGGIIIDGIILTGANGSGGEFGHMHIIDGEEEECGCGGHGCLEQYGSATGVVRLAKRALEASEKPSILREKEVSAKAVFDAVKEEDELAIEIAEQFGEILGKGLAMVASVVNPEIFVIGGGVSKAGEILFSFIKPPFEKYVFKGSRDTKFALASLGNDAGMIGAAKLILDGR